MPLLSITDPDDARLAPYRDLTRRNLIRRSGLFIAEGEKVVDRLIAGGFEVHSLCATPEYAERYAPRVQSDTPIYVASEEMLAAIAGFDFHRGVLACGRRQRLAGTADLAHELGAAERSTWVVCPNVQDPTNLGAILRSCLAFGVDGVLLGNESADPFSRRVVRVSMGAVFKLKLIETLELARDLDILRAQQFECVATVLDPAAEVLPQFRRGPRTALLFGSEGHGLGADWIGRCDRRVTLPMHEADSLNVAVAAGVFLYHFLAAPSG